MHIAQLRCYHSSSQSLQPLARCRFFMIDRNISYCISQIHRLLFQNDSSNTLKDTFKLLQTRIVVIFFSQLGLSMSDHIQYLFKYKKLCLPLELHPLMSSRMCFILELHAVIGHQESVPKYAQGRCMHGAVHKNRLVCLHQLEVYSLFRKIPM